MNRIVTGITLINQIKELREVPKLKDNINYFIETKKIANKYRINYADLFEPVLLSPFIKEGLLLPFWIFEFIKKVFERFLSEDEKVLLDKLLEIGESLTEIDLTPELKIGNYNSDSREFYLFKESVFKVILKYGKPIKNNSLLRKLFMALLSWKRDKEIYNIYKNISKSYKTLYRPDWDYFLRAVYVFALTDKRDFETILKTYYESERKKTNFYKDSIPTFAFARKVNFKDHKKDGEVDINFCRVGVYEDLKDINIFFPQKLLKSFEIDDDLNNMLKSEAKQGRMSIKEAREFLVEDLKIAHCIEGVLGFMGVYLEDYNNFRNKLNLPDIEMKYYIISNDAIIYKQTDSLEEIIDFVEKNNSKIKRLLRDFGVKRVTFEGELTKSLKEEKSLREICEEFDLKPINILRKIQGNSNLCKLVYEMLEEEEELEIGIDEKQSFFYNSKLKPSIIDEFITIIINKQKKPKKKTKQKEIPYSVLKKAVGLLLSGKTYDIVTKNLKYEDNIKVSSSYLKNEIEIYFGKDVEKDIKKAQKIRKKRGMYKGGK